MTPTPNPFIALAHSRKFWLLVFAVVQTLVAAYLNVRPEVWGAIDALIVFAINAIAKEDAAEKGAATVVNAGTVDRVTTNNASTTVDPPAFKEGL
jgi:hypothetical protein